MAQLHPHTDELTGARAADDRTGDYHLALVPPGQAPRRATRLSQWGWPHGG